MAKPLFIVFEGIDGSGKSTQVQLFAETLKAKGHKVYVTREPTGNYIGLTLREIFSGNKNAHDKTIAALYLADRLEHILNTDDGLLKMLNDGYTVICDRYYFSSYAYHSVHMPMNWVIEANSLCATLLKPDVNFFVDTDVDTAFKRITEGRDSIELYEQKENLEAVRNNYLEAFEKLRTTEKIITINGNASIAEVQENILQQYNSL